MRKTILLSLISLIPLSFASVAMEVESVEGEKISAKRKLRKETQQEFLPEPQKKKSKLTSENQHESAHEIFNAEPQHGVKGPPILIKMDADGFKIPLHRASSDPEFLAAGKKKEKVKVKSTPHTKIIESLHYTKGTTFYIKVPSELVTQEEKDAFTRKAFNDYIQTRKKEDHPSKDA